ncbi:MAG: ribonuclease J [Coriobacteriaceae bacterium]|nr:ribonuclease J [Coriobacteriaceae bacterium]
MTTTKNPKTKAATRKKGGAPLRIIPLGGLDGIGKNMTAYELGDDMILVDAGLMFPDDNQPGIDLVLPDYTYVLENEHKLRGIVITHGHEDHIGALPYLLKDLNNKVPIFSSKLTLGMIEGKIAEFRIRGQKFHEVTGGSHVNLGRFRVDFVSITHSIPGAFSLRIKTPQGTVFHTGDYKFDQTPIDGVRPDYAAISRFGAEGIDLLLSDSTNATRPGFTPSEASVGPSLFETIKNAQGRVFVATFSSQIHRLQQICDAARACGRKIVVTGRSMLTNTRVARELGYLKIDEEDLIDAFEINGIPEEKIVVMCTGSQGEPLSALSRMANGEHKTLSIHEGDTVILSATPVPGNEKAVAQVINSLAKLGCDVVDKSRALVHVSGHGSQEELKLMLAMTQPKFFMPVHGEAVHLRAHARLGAQMGIPRERIFIMDNGEPLEMRGGQVRPGTPIGSGVVYVDGLRIGDADPIVLRDRQRLANDGMVTAVAVVSLKRKRIDAVDFSARGVPFTIDDEFVADATDAIKKTIDKGKFNFTASGTDALRKAVRDSFSNFIWNRTKTRPMIIPVLMEV